jgi:FemAB-related protein (PEP-CTERM system-associated)
MSRFRHYIHLDQTERKLIALLMTFQFAPMRDVLINRGLLEPSSHKDKSGTSTNRKNLAKSTVCVREVEEPGSMWLQHVQENPSSCPGHDPRWARIFHQVFGHRPVYLQAEEAGEIQGVLPLVMMSSQLFGRFVVSMPYLNHGGICATSSAARDALLRKAIELSIEFRAGWLELRHETSVDWSLPIRQHKVAMRLPLPRSSGILFDSFPAKLRSQIRRAEKEKMTVRQGGVEEVSAFFKVFSRNMRDLGTPVYPRQFFDRIMGVFSETSRIFTVYHHTFPVASSLVIGFKDRLEIPWASSIRGYNRFGVNMLLYWSILEYACKQGYAVFDFGRSTPGSGTYRFKEQWGAKPVPLHWYYWLAPGETLPDLCPQNPKYKLAIKIWQQLPISVAEMIGPLISRGLP